MGPSKRSCCVTSAASAAQWRSAAAHGGAPGLLRCYIQAQLSCQHMTRHNCTCVTYYKYTHMLSCLSGALDTTAQQHEVFCNAQRK